MWGNSIYDEEPLLPDSDDEGFSLTQKACSDDDDEHVTPTERVFEDEDDEWGDGSTLQPLHLSQFDDLIVTPSKSSENEAQALPEAPTKSNLKDIFDATVSSQQLADSPKSNDEGCSQLALEEVVEQSEQKARKKKPVPVEVKLIAVYLHKHVKHSLNLTVDKIKKRFHVELQRIQVCNYVKDVNKIYASYSKDPKRARILGGGTKRAGVRKGTEESTISWITKQRADPSNPRVTLIDVRRKLGSDESPASIDVALSFLRAHALCLRTASVKEFIDESQIARLAQEFLTNSSHINRLLNLKVDEIVQLDEIATTMCGTMKNAITVVTENTDTGPVTFVRSCDLDDDKKVATGVHFLCTTPIPPILIFKRKTQGPVETKVHCKSIYAECATMNETIFSTVVIPHIKEYCPNARLLIFDSATSHYTATVRESCIQHGLGFLLIPAKCTPVLQSLDVCYFARYRKIHNDLVNEVIRARGIPELQGLTAPEKREILSAICNESHKILSGKLDVAQIFKDLGYIDPQPDTVTLRNLPSFTFMDPCEADYKQFLSDLHVFLKNRDAERTDVKSAVDSICKVPIAKKEGPKKRGRPPKELPGLPAKPTGPMDKFLKKGGETQESKADSVVCTQVAPVVAEKKVLGVRHFVPPPNVAVESDQFYRVLQKIATARMPGSMVHSEVLDIMLDIVWEKADASIDLNNHQLMSVANLNKNKPSSPNDIFVRPIAHHRHFLLAVFRENQAIVFDSVRNYYVADRDAAIRALHPAAVEIVDSSNFFQQGASNDCAFLTCKHLAHFLNVDIPCDRESLTLAAEQKVRAREEDFSAVFVQ